MLDISASVYIIVPVGTHHNSSGMVRRLCLILPTYTYTLNNNVWPSSTLLCVASFNAHPRYYLFKALRNVALRQSTLSDTARSVGLIGPSACLCYSLVPPSQVSTMSVLSVSRPQPRQPSCPSLLHAPDDGEMVFTGSFKLGPVPSARRLHVAHHPSPDRRCATRIVNCRARSGQDAHMPLRRQ